MPEITRFYGLIIKMFFADHSPPHIHVVYGEYNALYDIQSASMIEGDLPAKGQALVEEWISLYKNDLMDIWNTQNFRKLPPLK